MIIFLTRVTRSDVYATKKTACKIIIISCHMSLETSQRESPGQKYFAQKLILFVHSISPNSKRNYKLIRVNLSTYLE